MLAVFAAVLRRQGKVFGHSLIIVLSVLLKSEGDFMQIRKGSMDFSCPICKLPNVQNETEYRSYISWLKKWLSDRLSDRRYAMFKDLLKEQRSSFNSNYLKCQVMRRIS